MREIIFKAKRVDNGEWAEGLITIMWGQYHIKSPDDENTAYPIDTDTICQFTGMTDKNGNKIWGNDILRGHGNPDDLAKVVLGQFYIIDVETLEKVESVIGWHTEVIETDVISKVEPFCLPMPLTKFYIDRSEFEVIGNIFDNPKLIS